MSCLPYVFHWFQNQLKGDLLTNIVVAKIEDTECKMLLESLTISDLKKFSTKEIQQRLRDFHFQCCIKHGLALLAEQQQKLAVELVEKLPPQENPNPSRLKVIFLYCSENHLVCLRSYKSKQRLLDAEMNT